MFSFFSRVVSFAVSLEDGTRQNESEESYSIVQMHELQV